MSAQNARTGRLRKATALVPLALLSAAFTASIAGANAPAITAGKAPAADQTLPDGTAVPTQAIEAPASVSDGDSLGLGLGNADATQIVSTASTSGIPSAALSAYQRAETVINAADKSCNLTWQLIAAIGRVESNHGRANGNVLDTNGLATPGIFGIPLNGSNKTTEILDTDAGQYDNDPTYDRAVGPMQFIPSTWSVVGVDADGDGVRNPQDVDDAALGTAVYLCSGSDDLSTDAGQRAAVYRYNHSQSYVDLVLSIMEAYTLGDFTSVPNSTVAAGYLVRDPDPVVGVGNQGDQEIKNPPANNNDDEPTEPTDDPTDEPTTNGGGGNGNGNGGGNGNTNTPTLPEVDVPELPTTSIQPVDEILNLAQATAQCLADGISQLDVAAFAECLDGYMNPKTTAQKTAAAEAYTSFARTGKPYARPVV
jgi:membrane-bound lytic murein transglycosylase B